MRNTELRQMLRRQEAAKEARRAFIETPLPSKEALRPLDEMLMRMYHEARLENIVLEIHMVPGDDHRAITGYFRVIGDHPTGRYSMTSPHIWEAYWSVRAQIFDAMQAAPRLEVAPAPPEPLTKTPKTSVKDLFS